MVISILTFDLSSSAVCDVDQVDQAQVDDVDEQLGIDRLA